MNCVRQRFHWHCLFGACQQFHLFRLCVITRGVEKFSPKVPAIDKADFLRKQNTVMVLGVDVFSWNERKIPAPVEFQISKF